MDEDALEELVRTHRAHGYISKSCSADALTAKIYETIRGATRQGWSERMGGCDDFLKF
jgi:hypothetical protein